MNPTHSTQKAFYPQGQNQSMLTHACTHFPFAAHKVCCGCLVQGAEEILRSPDNIYGEEGDTGMTLRADTERDTFDISIDYIEARMLNKSAGKCGRLGCTGSMEL